MDPFKRAPTMDVDGVRARAQRLGDRVKQVCLATRQRCEGTVLEVNEKLELRMRETVFWKEELNKVLKGIKERIETLGIRKESLRNAISACECNLAVAECCINARKQFNMANLAGDIIQASLLQESLAIKKSLDIFAKTEPELDNQLRLLRKVRYNIEKDLERKEQSMTLDTASMAMARKGNFLLLEETTSSPNLEIKDHQRFNRPEIWQKHSDLIVISADLEVQNSNKLLDFLDTLFDHVTEELSGHLREVNRHFVEQISELKRSKSTLEIQVSKVNSQIKETLADKQSVLLETKEQQALMSLTRKRLSLHHQRPDLELCDDKVQKTIEAALLTANEALDTLHAKAIELDSAAAALRGCQVRLLEEISLKGNILELDEVECYVKHRGINIFGF